MNSVILGTIVGLSVGIILANFFAKGKELGFVFCGILGTIVGIFAGYLLSCCIASFLVPMKNVVYGPYKLASMRSTDGISGAFVFGSGTIDSNISYNYLQLLDNGSMVPGSVPADNKIRLIEDPSLKKTGSLSITVNEADTTSPWYPWSLGSEYSARTEIREFRVPVGSVVQQFSIK